MYPSFVLHTVAPVRSGVRDSLVIWFRGTDPAFASRALRSHAGLVRGQQAVMPGLSKQSDGRLRYLAGLTHKATGQLHAAVRLFENALATVTPEADPLATADIRWALTQAIRIGLVT